MVSIQQAETIAHFLISASIIIGHPLAGEANTTLNWDFRGLKDCFTP